MDKGDQSAGGRYSNAYQNLIRSYVSSTSAQGTCKMILQRCLEILMGFLMAYGLIISSYVCILGRIRKTRFRRHIQNEELILVIVITFGFT
ncbi:hypothetical protein cypCar_00041371 [Cyprinus carpio]|nr:hypothetical protein cypCar_00041371 [Cyprinus carpio]